MFLTCGWRRLLRVPWTARRSYQSILTEINPEYSLEGLMLKLNLQYFGHLMRRADSLENTKAGEDWGQEENGDDRGWEGRMASSARWTWIWASCGRWWRTEKLDVLQSMGSQRFRHNWTTELNWTHPLSNWSVNLSSSSFNIYPEFLQAHLSSTSSAALIHTISHLA